MTVFFEGRLRFEFGPSWEVVKYDGHRDHENGIKGLNGKLFCDDCKDIARCAQCKRALGHGTKVVDFVGRRQGRLYLIEVKDFRHHRIENKARITSGDLAFEVAIKVRDTIAGLVGALHMGASHAPRWRDIVGPLFRERPRVMFWLEEDLSNQRMRERGQADPELQGDLQDKLSWLTKNVLILNRVLGASDHDVTVHSISERVVALREIASKSKGYLSFDDICSAFSLTPQSAGQKIADLCERDVLIRENNRYRVGTAWDTLLEDP